MSRLSSAREKFTGWVGKDKLGCHARGFKVHCSFTGMSLPRSKPRFKYFLFLAQDCNFRLINRNVSSAATDPILGDGYGYFVNNAKYAEYIGTHITEAEISSCLGFQAMFLANRKCVKGLHTTGVGGVTCAHHNMWRPNGIEDLQLRERCVQVIGVTLLFFFGYLYLTGEQILQYGFHIFLHRAQYVQ
jgi:hypothetical protein